MKVESTHASNFDHVVESLVQLAYENEKHNATPEARGLSGTGKHKKSPIQNGAASAACLLIYIMMESMIRRSFYSLTDEARKMASSDDLYERYRVLAKESADLRYLKLLYNDLTTLRDAITHGYLFRGEILIDDNHDIVGIEEEAVDGRHKTRISGRLTPSLKLHISPNQMSFVDIAVFFGATTLLLEEADLGFRRELWRWGDDDWISPLEWFEKAFNQIQVDGRESVVWHDLIERIERSKDYEFLKALNSLE